MYCSRCGKKVLDSMLYCPFCGAEIIIPEQESYDDGKQTPPEPVKVAPVFSFELPDEPEPEPEAQTAEPVEAPAPETRLPWEIPEPEPDPEPESEPEPEPEPEPEKPALDRRHANLGNVVPGRRSTDTLVPDKASMFMDDEDDFDEEDDTDDYDDFEEELERQRRTARHPRNYASRYRPEPDDEDDEDDDDDESRSFIFRHIRGIVGVLLFLVLLAILAFYALSDSGQMTLAKINATLPLRPEIYSRIAYEYYQNGDYAQSGVYYERALARDDDNYNYASSAAMAYINGGNNDRAAEMLRKCVQLKPTAVEPYVYLLNLYPNANSRPWDVAQLLKQGYERTGDARLNVE